MPPTLQAIGNVSMHDFNRQNCQNLYNKVFKQIVCTQIRERERERENTNFSFIYIYISHFNIHSSNNKNPIKNMFN
jgi:hypothetical protein